MNWIEAFGIVGGIASIASLLYAFYFAKSSRRAKLLVYETHEIPLITLTSPGEDYSLSILFQKKGSQQESIERLHVCFLRFANLGKEPIRGSDIAPANPLRISIEGYSADMRTLDLALFSCPREANRVRLGKVTHGPKASDAEIAFDFLDYQDGAVVKILTDGPSRIRLLGDVIGMPSGVRRSDEIGKRDVLNVIGTLLAIFFWISTFVAVAFVYRWVTGSWQNIWLLLLLPLALVIAGVITAFTAESIWPSSKLPMPEKLKLPSWAPRFYPGFIASEAEFDAIRLDLDSRARRDGKPAGKTQ